MREGLPQERHSSAHDHQWIAQRVVEIVQVERVHLSAISPRGRGLGSSQCTMMAAGHAAMTQGGASATLHTRARQPGTSSMPEQATASVSRITNSPTLIRSRR